MSRPTKAESKRLLHLENALAEINALTMDAELTLLRTKQALRRDSSLRDLLTPAIDSQAEMLKRLAAYRKEIQAAIALD